MRTPTVQEFTLAGLARTDLFPFVKISMLNWFEHNVKNAKWNVRNTCGFAIISPSREAEDGKNRTTRRGNIVRKTGRRRVCRDWSCPVGCLTISINAGKSFSRNTSKFFTSGTARKWWCAQTGAFSFPCIPVGLWTGFD